MLEVAVDKTHSDKRGSNDKKGTTTTTSFDRKKEYLTLNTEAAGEGYSVAYASETPVESGHSSWSFLSLIRITMSI
jgi:hypothetical protein